MRAFVSAPAGLSRAMTRVANALAEYAPIPQPDGSGVQIVKTEAEADLVVLHVIGEEGITEAKRLHDAGKKYAIIQYCLRSTQKPDTNDWLETWKNAELVWSYYDLYQLCAEDGNDGESLGSELVDFNFYHAPLGVDNDKFRHWTSVPKRFEILTSGYVAESECVHEALDAIRHLPNNPKMYHLGPDNIFTIQDKDRFVKTGLGLDDDTLAQMYSRSRYVAGLRRVEGFELPAAEGLLCGARPICFDKPHYRKWFGTWAEYITEGSPQEVSAQLLAIFQGEYRAVTEQEVSDAKKAFDWGFLCGNFWFHALPKTEVKTQPKAKPLNVPLARVTSKPTMLFIGDAAVSSGFAKGTHNILETVRHHYNVHVLGLNHFGDPHDYPYPIYPCNTVHGGDFFGLSRINELVRKIGPDVAVVQNDPWNFSRYIKALGNVPTVGIVAVDGLNCQGYALNGLKLAIFWTQFGMEQARIGGYVGPATVIPLGVNRDIYYPRSKKVARERLALPRGREYVRDGFFVGNVNRNQPRKRIDLTIQYFAEWVKSFKIPDAFLYLHVAPTGDQGWDLPQLANYYGIANRLIYAEPEIGQGITEDELANTYTMLDVMLSTSQGEGMGLTTLESMACGVPNIGAEWAALADWAKDAMILAPCLDTSVTPRVNTIGGVPSSEHVVQALNALYTNLPLRESYIHAGLALTKEPQYDWKNIGESYVAVIDSALAANPTWSNLDAESVTVDWREQNSPEPSEHREERAE
jgi:D-inositol-3-phosphate glycosyltransferase